MSERESDALLIAWIVLATLWDFACLGLCSYEVFWRSHSGWWFLLAIMLTMNPTLFDVLAKRFGVKGA